MKHLLLVFYIFIIIFCQVLLYRSRKPLHYNTKQYDVNLWSLYDTITLCFLLVSYLLVYFIPHPETLVSYILAAILVGIVLQIHYFRRLRAFGFPKTFKRNSMLSFSLQYYSTVTLGFGLIIVYNLA